MPVMAGKTELPAIPVRIGALVDLQHQLSAVVEGFILDGCDAVRHEEVLQLPAARKCAAADDAEPFLQSSDLLTDQLIRDDSVSLPPYGFLWLLS